MIDLRAAGQEPSSALPGTFSHPFGTGEGNTEQSSLPFSRRRSRWEKVPDRADEGLCPRVLNFECPATPNQPSSGLRPHSPIPAEREKGKLRQGLLL